MKKTILFATAAILSLCLCACNDSQTIGAIGGADGPTTVIVGERNTDNNDKTPTDGYVAEAIKHTVNAASLAADESFAEAYGMGTSAKEILAQIGAGDYSEPDTVYELKINRDAAVKQLKDEDENDVYAKLLELSKFKLITFATSRNAMFGANVLAATSALTEREGYIMPENFDGDFALYLAYDGEYSAFVEFSKIGENVIDANMMFVKNGENGVFDFTEMLGEILGENYTFNPVMGN